MNQEQEPAEKKDEVRVVLSVVIATYNRLPLLLDLLNSFSKQTLEPAMFEVIVVDDGSSVPVLSALTAQSYPFGLTVIEQKNAGPAAARHRGIEEARGEIIVIVDDDMLVPPEFLHHHLRAHRSGATLVLGKMIDDQSGERPALFNRFHSDQLAKQFDAFKTQKQKPRGVNVCTGNVSFRRSDYFNVGGFDRSLARAEDLELGMRLEKAGAVIVYCDEALTINRCGMADREVWFQRNFLYGRHDVRIAKKHDDMDVADPWRFLFEVNPVSRPLLMFAAAFPRAGGVLSRAAMRVAEEADDRGFSRAGVAGATLSYGLEYFRGVRAETGGIRDVVHDFSHYLKKRRVARDAGDQKTQAPAQDASVFDEKQFYIDRNGQKIYCVHHPARGNALGAVLLIGALGLERTHAYLVWVQWARSLAQAGYHVFRFDFGGIGESTGEFSNQTLASWQADAVGVYSHVKQAFPRMPLLLHGLRGGCLIASHLFAENLGDALLLWEPPPSGEAMAMEILRRKLAADYAENTGGERKTRDDYIASMESGSLVEVEGYLWSKELWRSAKAYPLLMPPENEKRPYRIVHMDGRDPARALSKTHSSIVKIPKPFFWMESKVLQPDLNELFSGALAWLSSMPEDKYN